MRISDVAEALGVSKGTVSRAITGNGRIAPATRQRILAYMEQHDYKPNTIAQSLSTRKTMNIAFTVPTGRELIQLPFFLQCLVGAYAEAAANSYDILVVDNTYTAVTRVVTQQKVDGVIVSRNLVGSRMLGYLTGTSIPFILVGTTDHPDVLQIDHDHRTACREFTSLILDRWQGVPGLMAGSRAHLVSRARAKGFSEAAGSAPIVWGANDESCVSSALAQLLDAGVDIIFCEDDMICTDLEIILRSGRLDIDPSSVRVASFYSSPMLDALNPQLPALHFDAVDLGSRACATLLNRMAGQEVGNVTLGYTIVMPGYDRQPSDNYLPQAAKKGDLTSQHG